MRRQISIKWGTLCVILSILMLAPVLAQSKEKGKSQDDIIVTCPKPHQCVASPLAVQGKARGSWFFEATFPISLVDEQGNQLATSTARAKSDWMTKEYVPFEGKLDFTVAKATKAKLVLQNDNPSGLPENARKKEIPLTLVPKK